MLANVEEHPQVRHAGDAMDAAARELRDVVTRCEAARAELAAAEQAAADGRRDDKRLRAARDAVQQLESEESIAGRRVATAERAYKDTLRDTCLELERELVEAHRAALKRLDDALVEASRVSHEVATLENTSSRLFVGGPYRVQQGVPGRPLPRLAWWNEFGGPRARPIETRYGAWRKRCGFTK
jgi:hypothetical protein